MTEKRRKRRKRSSRRSPSFASSGPITRLAKNVVSGFKKLLFDSPVMYLPFMLLFLFNTTDFLILLEFENAPIKNIFWEDDVWYIEPEVLRYNAELVKQQFKYYILAFIVLSALGNLTKIVRFFSVNKNVVLLIVVMLSGYFYSVEPSKVLSNVANIVFSLVTCILLVVHQTEKRKVVRNAMLAIFISCSIVLIGGIFLLTKLNVDFIAFYLDGKRYGGLAGNANSQGLLALIAIWSGLALISEKSRYFWMKPLIFLLLVIYTALLVLSGSATAWVISGVALVFIFWGRFLQKASVKTSVTTNLAFIALILISATVFVTQYSGDYLSALTGAVGKDSSFTGRTALWEIAIAAIKESPLIGYSYDSHVSVFSHPEYAIPLHQYHNGYLDTLVAGGLLLLAVLIFHLLCFSRKGMAVIRQDKNIYIAMMPLLFLIMHNFTEYSILRVNSILWYVFMLGYAIVALYGIDTKNPVRQKKISSRRRGIRFA